MKFNFILAVCTVIIISIMVFSPAVAQDDGIRGIAVGGGEWTDEIDMGKTHFNLKGNFPGSASGGHLFVILENGFNFLVEADPDSVVFLDGVWPVLDGTPTVEGYAMWAIGIVVDSSFDGIIGSWCLMGVYDGGKSSHNRDFIMANPFVGDWYAAMEEYGKALNGEVSLWAEMVKGNTTINVKD